MTTRSARKAEQHRPSDICFVVNPVSGTSKADPLVAALLARLKRAGRAAVVYRTGQPDEARRLLAERAPPGRIVAAVGGDGTVREVVSGLLDRPRAVLVVPTGTENILAKELGLSADVELLWRTLLAGRARPMDVGLANGRVFLIVAGVGFDAQVVDRLVQTRLGHISRMSYFWPIWRTFWQYRFEPIRVEADGQLVCDEPALVFIGNLARYSVGLRILRQARPDDGRLDLCIYRCRWQWPLLRHAWRTMLGCHVGRPDVIYRQCTTIRVSGPSGLTLQTDGDPAGSLPAEFSILPRRALFLVPDDGPANREAQ